MLTSQVLERESLLLPDVVILLATTLASTFERIVNRREKIFASALLQLLELVIPTSKSVVKLSELLMLKARVLERDSSSEKENTSERRTAQRALRTTLTTVMSMKPRTD